ncbi:hypothetical protein, partial [Campylobacter vicugnae]|uniref:hypothetical protein n=1 Tax=Campylobacter vicugnae TaxID=1660076 RepID=UPI00112F7F9E
MNKLMVKYIGGFFLFLILVLGCMGFIIYDKLMIEYKKRIKEVIMWSIDNSEIKDQGTNIAQWDIVGDEIERVKSLDTPNEMFKRLSSGETSGDVLQSEINMVNLEQLTKVGERQLERVAELKEKVFDDKNFYDKIKTLLNTDKYTKGSGFNESSLKAIGSEVGHALRRNMSEEEFSVLMRKEYAKAPVEAIRAATEAYKDISSIFNQEINSQLNNISLKNYD